MIRKGKIARLPRAIRDELNRRLDNGEAGVNLVAWLNELPETRQVLAEKFGGRPITAQNMSEWTHGGYLDWLNLQGILDDAQELDADAAQLIHSTKGRLSDHMATILSARYATLLAHWRGDVSPELTRQLQVLQGMSQVIVRLRRGDHHAARLDRESRREEKEREKSNAEVIAHFKEWAEHPEIHELICRNCSNPKTKDRALDEMFGLQPPLPKNKSPGSPNAPEPPAPENPA